MDNEQLAMVKTLQIAGGFTAKEIADRFGVAVEDVKNVFKMKAAVCLPKSITREVKK